LGQLIPGVVPLNKKIMQESQFQNWLIKNKYDERTISSRLSNCRRIEEYEGDLDEHFNKNSGISLLKRLKYSSQDQANIVPQRHNIPINGNVYNGTATFRSAANLYFKFRSSVDSGSSEKNVTTIVRRTKNKKNLKEKEAGKSKSSDTPINKLSQFEFDICKILAQLCYHIHPKIIHRIQEENEREYEYFRNLFSDIIDIESYLFKGSACIFPGVRRYVSGQGKKKQYNEQYRAIIDDNTFPRHLWCFLVNNKTYNGPNWKESGLNQYELAHIFTHKQSELEFEKEFFKEFDCKIYPHGDFTCACNIVLLPKGTVRPTDNSKVIKSVFYKRYIDLYGETPLQGRKEFITSKVPDWYNRLKWNVPFCPKNWEVKVEKLLQYRTKRLTQLIENI
jgi:hypothetical protein